VSNVLNRRPDVAASTIEAVQAALQELNYTPRRRGRPRGARRHGANAGRRTNRIALLVPGIPRSYINSPVYMDVLHGVEAAVRSADKSFVLLRLEPGAPCPSQLFPQKVDGVVLFGPVADKRLAAKLHAMPCVQVMGRIEREGWWDQVSYDNARLGEIAAGYLLGRGHRDVAFVSNSDSGPHLVERCYVFKESIRTAGGDCLELIDDQLLTDTGTIQQVNQQRLATLLDQVSGIRCQVSGRAQNPEPGPPSPALDTRPRHSPPPLAPTALFLAGDVLAPAVCGELQRRGLVVGQDIDVVSCNNEQMLLSHLHPRPATIDIHAERVGHKAVEQLLWRIQHPTAPRATTALEPTLVEGTRLRSKSYGGQASARDGCATSNGEGERGARS
jgi:DNA-binding LacI/PurR family transcriptional regulator